MSRFGGIEALVIHLSRAEARRPQVERILNACPVPARVIEAVDGRALTEDEIGAVFSQRPLHFPRYPFFITAGEIGCFLSHRRAWRIIVESGLGAGLILEDDVEIDRDAFARALALATQYVGQEGYIQFQVRPVADGASVVTEDDGVSILRPPVAMLRTSAQLVSAAQARRLLQITDRFDRPVDGLLQLSWVTGVAPSCAVPSGVSDRTQQSGGSTISTSSRGSLMKTLAREFHRLVYRRRIRALSARYLASIGGQE
ncbi:MAG: glycosyltransferase family 25 protein [Hoeflea sp.]|uniref:glycosyltransferase family 25 protein n=1 Tax=Hoeflea sp. TaxID=1940281 RepID=UPI0032EC01BA